MLMDMPCRAHLPPFASQLLELDNGAEVLLQVLECQINPIKVYPLPHDESENMWIRGDLFAESGRDWTIVVAVKQQGLLDIEQCWGALLQVTHNASSSACIEYEVLAPEDSLRLFQDGQNELSARKAIIPIPKHMTILTRDDRCTVHIGEGPLLYTAKK